MASECILLVEDEESIVELVRYNLVREGYVVHAALSGEEGLSLVRTAKPDLILLDIMLPEIGGVEVCRRLRREEPTMNTPIIMLTARGEESDIVAGLEAGADDYVTKPFSPRVLMARVRAALRRRSEPAPTADAIITVNDLVIHPGRHEVTFAGQRIDLTHTEFRILHYLARRPGWVFTRYQIVDAVHGQDHAVTDRSVDVQIVGLRKKLGEAGAYIETVRGVGYRFKEQD
jgi:two-component system alkaline phosphatase synthesis response regulator PhoP